MANAVFDSTEIDTTTHELNPYTVSSVEDLTTINANVRKICFVDGTSLITSRSLADLTTDLNTTGWGGTSRAFAVTNLSNPINVVIVGYNVVDMQDLAVVKYSSTSSTVPNGRRIRMRGGWHYDTATTLADLKTSMNTAIA